MKRSLPISEPFPSEGSSCPLTLKEVEESVFLKRPLNVSNNVLVAALRRELIEAGCCDGGLVLVIKHCSSQKSAIGGMNSTSL